MIPLPRLQCQTIVLCVRTLERLRLLDHHCPSRYSHSSLTFLLPIANDTRRRLVAATCPSEDKFLLQRESAGHSGVPPLSRYFTSLTRNLPCCSNLAIWGQTFCISRSRKKEHPNRAYRAIFDPYNHNPLLRTGLTSSSIPRSTSNTNLSIPRGFFALR